jgi:hypothetical protein
VTKTHALEALVIAGFVRGLSVRDVEAALAEALGSEAALSKSTVSRVCAEIKGQFEAWQQRRLDDVDLDYLSGWFALQVSRQRRGRAGAGRLGHHYRGQARVRRAGRRGRRVQ